MYAANNTVWETLTPEEKNLALYERQKAMLDSLLKHGANTQAQHGKSLHDLTIKQGYTKGSHLHNCIV